MGKTKTTTALSGALAALSLLVSACTEPTAADLLDRMNELQAQINVATADRRCSTVEECRYMALGAKACGGPTDHVVYSIVHTDSTALRALVDEYTQLNRQYNEKTAIVSTCDVVEPPTLFRQGGLCVGLSGVTRQMPHTPTNRRPIP